jgi:hypothetical protein
MSYPYQFFGESSYKLLLLFFPLFITSSLIIPILLGSSVDDLMLKISVFLGIFLFSLLILIVNWKYGLKKYEAFG